jgi:hypothetical protein
MNAALLQKTSIRRCTSLCPVASIRRVVFQSQLSTWSGYAFADDNSTSESKVPQQRSNAPRLGRKKDLHLFSSTPILPTQAP